MFDSHPGLGLLSPARCYRLSIAMVVCGKPQRATGPSINFLDADAPSLQDA